MSEKKRYQISTYTEEDWDYVHEILTQDGSLDDNIPTDQIDCVDMKEHSPTRGIYLLSDEEAELLRNHPKVRTVDIDRTAYPDLFPPPPPEEFYATPRYNSPVKNYRDFTSILPNPATVNDLNRAGYQLLRCQQVSDPWHGGAASAVLNQNPEYEGDGTDVDVIVGDDGCWFGHVEFQNNATGAGDNPNYVGGNVLPGNGTCDLLDLVLDAPYYIDPAWFNADPGTRLTTRWDGTTVPVESVARNWWSNASQRSASFASAGTVSVSSGYTRAFCNGSNTARASIGSHGTPCCALTYGRTHGWAFNANKWFVNVYNSNGILFEAYFDMMKIFHLSKPINPTHGTRDPTISSNSWGFRATPPSSGYYYYRGDTAGVSYASATKPGFMKYVGLYGDGGRMKGEMVDNSMTVAGEEMIAAGVIFVGAAGNSNQKQVGPNHPDFNNYYNSGPNQLLTDNAFFEFGYQVRPTTNRRGFPQHIGKTAEYVYPVINIGALDDAFTAGGLERKVTYSDMGEEIDCYAPADGTLAATYSGGSPRWDTYPGGSLSSTDARFSGTSAACPVATGLLATKLQYNRSWTWQDIRNWLRTGLELANTDEFYTGRESITANDVNWADVNSLEGGAPIVLYDGQTLNISSVRITGLSLGQGIRFRLKI